MSYKKQTWKTGDTIAASMLNHMEAGISENAENLAVALQRNIDLTTCTTITEASDVYDPIITANSISAAGVAFSIEVQGQVEIKATTNAIDTTLTINGVQHTIKSGESFLFSGKVNEPIIGVVEYGQLTFEKFAIIDNSLMEKVTLLEKNVGNIDEALDEIIEIQDSLINGTASVYSGGEAV